MAPLTRTCAVLAAAALALSALSSCVVFPGRVIDFQVAGEARFEPSVGHTQRAALVARPLQVTPRILVHSFDAMAATVAGVHVSVRASTGGTVVSLARGSAREVALNLAAATMRSNQVTQEQPLACVNPDASPPPKTQYVAERRAERAAQTAVRLGHGEATPVGCFDNQAYASIYRSGYLFDSDRTDVERAGLGNTFTMLIPAVIDGVSGRMVIELKAVGAASRVTYH